MKQEIKLVLLLILITGFYFRYEALVTPRDFWHDEAFQYLYSEKPVSYIVDSNDVHPPLFNLFTKLLLSLGIKSIFWLRFSMLMISMLFLYFFFMTMNEIFNETVAIVSTTAISLSFTFIFYSVEFRNYIFVLLFVILQIREFNRVIDKNKSSTMYWVYSLIMIYSHYLSGLIILCQAIYFVFERIWMKMDVRMELWKSYILMFLFSIPLFVYLINTLPKIQSFWFKDIDFISLISTYAYILAPPTGYIYGFATFYLVIIGCLIYFRKHINAKVIQFILYLTLPVLLMWTISQSFPFYHHRYFLFGGISFFVLLGWSASMLRKYVHDDLDMFIMAVWVVLLVGGATAFYSSFDSELYDSALFLYNYTNNATDDFNIVHTSTFSQSPYKVYFPTKTHFLKNNLTRQQLFTAGGSVVADREIISDSDLKYILSKTKVPFYFVSDKPVGDIIYEKGGIYVTKIE